VPDGARARLGVGTILSAALSPDEEFLAVGTTTGVYVYQMSTFEQVCDAAAEWAVYEVEWLRNGSFLLASGHDTSGWHHMFAAWAWQNGRGSLLPEAPDAIPPDEVGISSPTYYVGETYDRIIEELLNTIVDRATGEVVSVLDPPEPDLEFLARLEHFRFSPSYQMVAGYTGIPNGDAPATDHRIYVWDVNTGEQLYVLDGHTEFLAVNEVSWSPDGARLVSGAGLFEFGGEVILWDMGTGEMHQLLLSQAPSVKTVSWSPNGDWIAAGSGHPGGQVTVWEGATGDPLFTWNGYQWPVQHLIWLSGGRRLIAASRDAAVLWDVETRLPINMLHGSGGVPGERMEVLFSPDGRTVSVDYGGDETVVWNGETGEFILQTMGQEHYPDWENYGIDVVWVERNEEFFRRQEDGPALARLGTTFDLRGEHEAEIFTLLLSPDGSILASAGGIPPEHGYPLYEGWEENAVIVWDTATGEPIHRFLGHTGRVVSLSWSPDGQILASGSLDGTVILWEMTPQR
jgi:WD40 repeat protein